MANEPHLTERERADLVAYLDGELKGEAARALESKLQLSPEARAEAESLKRTWDLLDYLPRPEPSPRFTERTLSRLSPLSAAPTSALAAPSWRRWAWVAAWAAAVVVAFAAGWVGYNLLVGPKAREPEQVQDPRAVEIKRLYDATEDPDFLKALGNPDLFGDNTRERYAAWLERLREEDRQRLAAPAPENRLSLIREIRDREYLEHLPARVQEEVQRLPEGQRPARLAQLRREEAQQRSEWLRQARQQPNPWAAPPTKPRK